MIAYENYLIDRISTETFGNAVGDTPVVFDWIGGQSFNGIPMTGVHSMEPHGLAIGDYVLLVSSNPRYNGKFQVKAIGDDTDPVWASTIFDIAVTKGTNEEATGTWQKTTKDITCSAGQTKVNGVCVIKDDNTLTIFGKTFTYGQIGAFFFSLVLVSFALAFPLKSPSEIAKTIQN
jgi:hypothetical protein